MEKLSVSDFWSNWERISWTIWSIVYGKRYEFKNWKPQELWTKKDIWMDEFWCALEEEMSRVAEYNKTVNCTVDQVLSQWTYPDYNETGLRLLLDRIEGELPEKVKSQVNVLLSKH